VACVTELDHLTENAEEAQFILGIARATSLLAVLSAWSSTKGPLAGGS
jgi:hypothetical protein